LLADKIAAALTGFLLRLILNFTSFSSIFAIAIPGELNLQFPVKFICQIPGIHAVDSGAAFVDYKYTIFLI